ncbi:hypothetical protein GCM10025759_22940 [Lysobacter panacisoli]|uniref:Uncharacterized protein n=1 Tax=Lysobacter panacisoli TaxID=1255263 RepID=A0ABP9LKJ7_9GAMM
MTSNRHAQRFRALGVRKTPGALRLPGLHAQGVYREPRSSPRSPGKAAGRTRDTLPLPASPGCASLTRLRGLQPGMSGVKSHATPRDWDFPQQIGFVLFDDGFERPIMAFIDPLSQKQ